MSKYWVSLNIGDECDLAEAQKILYKEMTDKFVSFGFLEDTNSALTYKTHNEDDAKRKAEEAYDIVSEYFTKLNWYCSKENVSIVKQPECPKCGALGRFSACFCSTCGSELSQKEYIEF